jgi:hypothetical protein
MRQVGRGLRQYLLTRDEAAKTSPKELQDQLSVLRLSLPPHFLNPMRNALQNESPLMHHARLVTTLHLHMAKLLIAILCCGQCPEGEEWLLGWQQVLETSEDIATILAQWNPTYSICVDPAICFIIFTALIFIHVHTKTEMVALSHLSSLKHHESVLLLQLEQFATSWTLSKLLICKFPPLHTIPHCEVRQFPTLALVSFKGVKETLKGPLSNRHIQYIISHFEAPLHPRWLQFLSSIQINLESCV